MTRLSTGLAGLALAASATTAMAETFRCPSKTPAPEYGRQPDRRFALLAQISPFQRWSCLDGEVIGILSAFSGEVAQISWAPFALPLGAGKQPYFSYTFTTAIDSPRALYFAPPPSPQGNPIDLQVTDGRGASFTARSSMLLPPDKRQLRLTSDVHLVRLRVNAGRGSNGGVHFITDRVEVLDRTAAFPLDVGKLVHGVLDPLTSTTTTEGKRWRRLLNRSLADEASRDPAFAKFANTVASDHLDAGHRITWHADRRVLAIIFYAQVHRTRILPPPASENPRPAKRYKNCRGGCPMRALGYNQSVEYAVEVEYSHEGKLVRRYEHPVRSPKSATQLAK